MTEIYSRATRVVVWLGEAGDDGGAALETLRALASENADRKWLAITPRGRDNHSDLDKQTTLSSRSELDASEKGDLLVYALLQRS